VTLIDPLAGVLSVVAYCPEVTVEVPEMKTIAIIVLLSGSLWAQSESIQRYPLTLTVMSAQISKDANGTSTQINSYLSDDPLKQPVHMVCDVAMSSRGPDGKANTYPARYSYKPLVDSPNHIRIYAREPGKSIMREYKCVAQAKR
jgi:hypothetical protein